MTHNTWTYKPHHARNETDAIAALLNYLDWNDARAQRVSAQAEEVVKDIRAQKSNVGEIETMLNAYPLHTREGLALMTLAESVLRIPDTDTLDALISEKLSQGDWGKSGGTDWFTSSAGVGLGLAQKTLGSMLGGLGKPVIRTSIAQVMRRMGGQFVLGETIDDALRAARDYQSKNYRLSYDMLGEGARTYSDSRRYFKSYLDAVEKIGATITHGDVLKNPCISVKLSALHPRYTWSRASDCVPALVKDMVELCTAAKAYNMAVTMDAEESDRLDLSLDIFAHVRRDPLLHGWHGLGLAVQAYDKRAFYVIDDILSLAHSTQHQIHVRLVKGAYWDSEIKKAQIMGVDDYPVFTRKENTDISYLACAQKLLNNRDHLYPMLATHNAHTALAIIDMAGNAQTGFEFQRLHGMGQSLGDRLVRDHSVTIYAPVGPYHDLLPYLVRRMLENGASTSFVQSLRDHSVESRKLADDVVTGVRKRTTHHHDAIALPQNIYGDARKNSRGFDVAQDTVRQNLKPPIKIFDETASIIKGEMVKTGSPFVPHAPFDMAHKLPPVWQATPDLVDTSFHIAKRGFETWSHIPVAQRADCLRRFGNKLESEPSLWIARLQTEAGKTLNDAIAEWREAIDFCRYYAHHAQELCRENGVLLNGYTGEENRLVLKGRGVFVCISPWNFPLAIFIGQVAAALVTGNAVICKPAEQTPHIAAAAVRDLISCGVPPEAITLLLGDGTLGAALVAHKDVAGVAFTGSTDVARIINRSLAAKDGPIVPFIAETGGQNAMIIDSTALLEQTVDDVVISAFGSAGQRCSALRVVYVQRDILPQFEHLLSGMMHELHVGNPCDWGHDIGPVIDKAARDSLMNHITYLDTYARKIAAVELKPVCNNGFFVPPVAYEIPHINFLTKENFGPILHVISFESKNINQVINDINTTGYGLTFGIQSRLETRATTLAGQSSAGNIYINRSMTGAVVGVQPFGGSGLSGTGPKAGGPYYLHRFTTEKTITNNTAALGGNVTLLLMKDQS